MALILLRVLVVGVIAAAADDVPITWSSSAHYSLRCVVPEAYRLTQASGKARRNDTNVSWYKDEQKEPINKRLNPKGELEVGKRNGSGVYRCAIKHGDGVVLGYPINLKFPSMAKQISGHPANGTAWLGQPYVLSCNISSGPPANITWTKDGDQIRHSRHYVLDNELLFPKVERDDEGLYKCIATNTYVNKSRTSHGGRLQVVDSSGEQPFFLTMQHKDEYFVSRGQNVQLPCALTGWPSPKIIWKKDDEVLDSKDQVLSVDVDGDATYTCEHENVDMLYKTFKLIVMEPVKITLPPKSREAPRARTVRFNCSATGKPEPKVTWYKDGKPLVLAGRIKLLRSPYKERLELVISGVTSQDAGVYQCFASNGLSVVSSWATLSVVGDTATAPAGVKCSPAGAKLVSVSWTWPYDEQAFAYIVERTPLDKSTPSLTGEPLENTEEQVSVSEALSPYQFQVRAFINPSSEGNKNIASDFSKTVVCQGQGVPVKLTKVNENELRVSWEEFVEENPGIVQWVLQYRLHNNTEERNLTLDGNVYEYTLNVSGGPPVEVRVLGSRSLMWLRQDLSLVPWTASDRADTGELRGIPKIEETSVNTREFSIKVHYEQADPSADNFKYNVCIRRSYYEDEEEECRVYNEAEVAFQNLEPNTRYVVRAQVRLRGQTTSGKFSSPLTITTKTEVSVKDIKYKYLNSSALRVSWSGVHERYAVSYSPQIMKPLETWTTVYTDTNYVLLTDVDSRSDLYVIVKASDSSPAMDAPVLTIPSYEKNPTFEYTSSGILVTFATAGPSMVRFAQNITAPMEHWTVINTTASSFELTGVDLSRPTYVIVYAGKKEGNVLTVPPRPTDNHLIYLSVGIVCAVLILCLLLIAAFCFWKRRKRARSPLRSRRRNLAGNETADEEGTEMKNIGGRLANGGAKDADEPLLNGHVHITENPNQLKTPNGKMRRGRNYEAAFDVSRYNDTTLETVLDPDTSASTTFHLLDTSRRPEYELSRSSRDVSTNNSFNKLPDDNMNSELSTDFDNDNSTIQPTLQPNG